MFEGKYRGAYRRMFKIDELIRSNRCISSAQLAKKLGVSKRTIQRDLRYMEVELSAPIVYDDEERGYFYANPRFSLSDFAFTDSDVALLVLSKQILESLFAGTFYQSKISGAFRSVVEHAGQMPEMLNHVVRNDIEIALPNAGDFRLAEKILDAMRERLCVLAQKGGSETLVRPIRIVYAWNDWFLLYITEDYKDNEDFRIERLESFDGFKVAPKAASARIKDIVANVDEWSSQTTAGRFSRIERTDEHGEVLRIIVAGKADTFNLLYKRNESGELEFIKTKETMLGGHVLETVLDLAKDVKIEI